MRPAPESRSTTDGHPSAGSRPGAQPEVEPASPDAGKEPPEKGGHRPLKPIGPAALKALREAIRSGKYPSDDVVVTGLLRMMRNPPAPAPEPPEPSGPTGPSGPSGPKKPGS